MWIQVDLTNDEFKALVATLTDINHAAMGQIFSDVPNAIIIDFNGPMRKPKVHRIAFSPGAFERYAELNPDLFNSFETSPVNQPEKIGIYNGGWGFLSGNQQYFLKIRIEDPNKLL